MTSSVPSCTCFSKLIRDLEKYSLFLFTFFFANLLLFLLGMAFCIPNFFLAFTSALAPIFGITLMRTAASFTFTFAFYTFLSIFLFKNVLIHIGIAFFCIVGCIMLDLFLAHSLFLVLYKIQLFANWLSMDNFFSLLHITLFESIGVLLIFCRVLFLLLSQLFLHCLEFSNLHFVSLHLIKISLHFFYQSIPIYCIIFCWVVVAEGLVFLPQPSLQEQVVSASVLVVLVFFYFLSEIVYIYSQLLSHLFLNLRLIRDIWQTNNNSWDMIQRAFWGNRKFTEWMRPNFLDCCSFIWVNL